MESTRGLAEFVRGLDAIIQPVRRGDPVEHAIDPSGRLHDHGEAHTAPRLWSGLDHRVYDGFEKRLLVL